MKLVIKGNSQRISMIMLLIAEYDKTDPMEMIGNTIDSMRKIVSKAVELSKPRPMYPEGTQHPAGGPAIVSDGTKTETVLHPQANPGPAIPATPAAGAKKPAAAKKAEPAAAAATNGAAATLTPEQTAELKEITDFTLDRGGQGHAPAIKAKLAELGVARAGQLPPDKWNVYRVFLQTLEDKDQLV